MKKQAGFTLIELIVVIIILGILAATALPKFADLQDEAKLGAAKGVAGALASASSMNYGLRKASNTVRGIPVLSCTAAQGLSLTGVELVTTAPANDKQYQVGGAATCADGESVTCTITPFALTSGLSPAEATVVCAS